MWPTEGGVETNRTAILRPLLTSVTVPGFAQRGLYLLPQ
jgi:hypothetical protein